MNWLVAAGLWGLLQGGPFDGAAGARVNVLLFLSTDCPISNRYAPEVQRLHEKFAPRGVAFWLVYPNPAESDEAVRDHAAAFRFPGRVVRDPRHALVRRAKATVTPEAAVFEAGGRILYRGRIDDRHVNFGVDRPAATTRDLDDALAAVVAGRAVAQPETRAVGCFLADLLP
jgi:hypothetical protein